MRLISLMSTFNFLTLYDFLLVAYLPRSASSLIKSFPFAEAFNESEHKNDSMLSSFYLIFIFKVVKRDEKVEESRNFHFRPSDFKSVGGRKICF